MTQVRASQVECRTYGAQIILGIEPQPFRAGLTFRVGPLGLASMAILQCHFFLNLL